MPLNTENPPKPLRDSAQEAIGYFLSQLEGNGCTELYQMVLAQVEEPLLNAVMAYTRGNQSKASTMLGLNRGTLRKKLRQYNLLDKPGY
jgi:Fis family transcriptional regulator